jgi:hypothetical protein
MTITKDGDRRHIHMKKPLKLPVIIIAIFLIAFDVESVHVEPNSESVNVLVKRRRLQAGA